jgi:hypothetical protein
MSGEEGSGHFVRRSVVFFKKEKKRSSTVLVTDKTKNDRSSATGRLSTIRPSALPASHMLALWRLSLFICSSSGASWQKESSTADPHTAGQKRLHDLHRLLGFTDLAIWQSNHCTINFPSWSTHKHSVQGVDSKNTRRRTAAGSWIYWWTLREHLCKKNTRSVLLFSTHTHWPSRGVR